MSYSPAPFYTFQTCHYTPVAVSRALNAALKVREWVVRTLYARGEPWPIEATSFVNVIDDLKNHETRDSEEN